MQPFPVICETCGAKLKVRDPSAVGQIHACPKCDSMVLIALPAAMAESKSSAPSLTTTSLASASTMVPADFATEVDDLLQPPSLVQEAELFHEPVADPAASDAEITAAVGGGASRSLWIWGGVGCAACFSVGLLVAAWMSGSDEPVTPQVAANSVAPVPADETKPPVEQKPSDTTSESVAVSKPVIETPELPPLEALGEATEEPVTASAPEPLPALPPVPTEEEPAEETEVAAAPQRKPLPTIDPLAIDSANLDLLLIPDAADAAPAQPVIAEATEPIVDEPRDAVDLPAPAGDRRFEPGSASRGPSYAEALAEGELDSRLAMKLPAVAWKDVPLVVAFRELEQLSGVPVTVDPEALKMAGVDVARGISVESQNSTVRELAAKVAATVRLQVVPTPDGLALVKTGADKWRNEVKYDVDDLASDAVATQALADLVRQVVAPASWDDRRAKMRVENTSFFTSQETAVHYDTLIFLERLRLARGLPARSKYPAAALAVEPRLASLGDRLKRPMTFAFVDWTPLGEVFDYWQQTGRVTILTDWQQLADQDLRPLATMAGSVDNLGFAAAMDASLTPLGLAWVPVDGNTIEITTRDTADATRWVEFYQNADETELRDRIESRVDPASLEHYVISPDASGKFVIVYGNREVHQAAAK
ncbi:hypothetical protein [Aeoliella sp. SH292]|uniref:hypothetical protein n=1 Tax=Aeoliella sp. SH292 TaxID=3454464 RepID=UPI003F9C4335